MLAITEQPRPQSEYRIKVNVLLCRLPLDSLDARLMARLWKDGSDTQQIARHLRCTEAVAYNTLAAMREQERRAA